MSNETKSAVIRSAGLLGVKSAAFLVTGSAVLLAGMIDSVVDVIASLIAHVVKPSSPHEEHQIALIQSFWIFAGGLIVLIESIRNIHEPVEMAYVGVAILILTLIVDATIVQRLKAKQSNPVIHGLREDIKADMTNSAGGLIALSVIALGAPGVVDKFVAIVISIYLIIHGLKMAHDNMVEASEDHDEEHPAHLEGYYLNPTSP